MTDHKLVLKVRELYLLATSAFPKNETDHVEEKERKSSAWLVFEKVTHKLLFFRFEISHFTALQRQSLEDI